MQTAFSLPESSLHPALPHESAFFSHRQPVSSYNNARFIYNKQGHNHARIPLQNLHPRPQYGGRARIV
ncbi:hypothetical protein, partial [Kingella denitrificans]